jgi:hypothetical protein
VRVDVLELSAEVLEGDHINWYLQTVWEQGEYCPQKGYAGIFRQGGRLFCIDGEDQPEQPPGTVEGRGYQMRIEVHDRHIVWHVPGHEPIEHRIGGYRKPNRRLGVGCWGGHVAFDDIIFEGQLESE